MADFSKEERRLLRELLDERQCRELIGRYAFAVDWKDWKALKPMLWPDADVDFGMWQGDREGFMTWVENLENGYSRRMHMFGYPRLTVSGDTAKAETCASTFLRSQPEGEAEKDEIMFIRYLFTFEKRDDEWRMARIKALVHGFLAFAPGDQGGAPFFADNMDTGHTEAW